MRFQDLTGQHYNKLTVIEYVGKNRRGQSMWLCRCDCGNFTTVSSANMKAGSTKSCGCHRSQSSSERLRKRITTHNLSTTSLYSKYDNIKQRCYNVTNKDYKYYGARDIKMCDEWRNNFKVFYDWSMANGYADDLTIDRIDNDSDYCPENCRWVTRAIQAKNRRTTKLLTYNGKTQTVTDWAHELGIPPTTLFGRINQNRPIEEIMFKGKLKSTRRNKNGVKD